MNKKSPLISYVVLNWNTLKDTKSCIRSIKDQLNFNGEIIVVDNGSTDGSKNSISKMKDVIYINLSTNQGFTGGQIEAIKKCNGDYIALVNSDAVLSNTWTENILKTFNKYPLTAAVGGKAFEWNDSNPLYNENNDFFSYQVIDSTKGYAETMRAGEEEIEVNSISGAGVIIKKRVVEKIGYFDNDFFAYYEETDLFARMIRAGYKVFYQPKAHLWHQIGKSSKGIPFFYLYQMNRNRFIFGFKNFDKVLVFSFKYFFENLSYFGLTKLSKNNIEAKARRAALLWNLKSLLITYKKRRKIARLGKTYSEIISSHKMGTDVTIIIPSYNYAKYLRESIESALNQSHKPYRVIVIDDGSTDESVDVAKSIEAPEGIKYDIIVKKNEGVIATKNLGIKLSTTTWTIFLDADDILEKNYIKSTLSNALSTNADVVYTDMHYFGSKEGIFSADPFSHKRLISGNFINNSALLNTNILKRTGGYKQEMNEGYEDWELYLSFAEIGAEFIKCSETYLLYRQHIGGISRNQKADENGEKIRERALLFHNDYVKKYSKKPLNIRTIFRVILKDPEIIFIIPFILLYSILRSTKEYILTIRVRALHITRTYLHNKRGGRIN